MSHAGQRALAGLVGLVVVLAAGAADEFKAEAGSTSLFNGKDLTGWRYGKKGEPLDGKTETADKRIEVQDGAIVMNAKDAAGKGGIKDLYTVQEYDRDFSLKMEFRASEKSDSGVYVRGPQLQIRDFIRLNQQKQLGKFKNDDWNELEITVKGTEATSKINGEELKPATLKVPARGPIGLQAETGKFEFRRVRIKELP